MNAAGRRLDVLVKVDVGFHRCGIDPEAPQALGIIKGVSDLSDLAFRGLLSHAGHAYHASSVHELAQIAEREIEILRGLATQARGGAVDIQEISVGSTPSARFVTLQKGVTEMRPGNYVFFDRTQVGLDSSPLSGCAMTVVSTVVSRPAANRVIFHAGSKTLTNDGIRGFGTMTGLGLVFPNLDTAQPVVTEAVVEPVATLKIWADDTRTPSLLDMADEFLAEYNVELVVEDLGVVQDIRSAVITAAPAGEGPDIFIGVHDWLGALIESGLVTPLDLGDKRGAFVESALDAFTYTDGQLYGVPYATDNLGGTEVFPETQWYTTGGSNRWMRVAFEVPAVSLQGVNTAPLTGGPRLTFSMPLFVSRYDLGVFRSGTNALAGQDPLPGASIC